MKPLLRWMRCRAESAAFLLACLAFFHPLLFVRRLRYGGDRRAIAYIRSRWRTFLTSGFTEFRKAFWPGIQFEDAVDIWFYVLHIEYFAILNATMPSAASAPSSPPQKILVVQLAHIGDLLHTFPMVKTLHEQLPDARLDLLIGPWGEGIAAPYAAYYDCLLTHTPHLGSFERGNKSTRRPARKERAFLKSLRTVQYDVVLSANPASPAQVLLLYAIHPHQWIGTTLPGLYAMNLNPSLVPYESQRHEADRIMDLLTLMDLEPAEPRLFYPLTSFDKQVAQTRLSSLGLSPDSHYMVIAPGAGWPGKQWPAARFAALINEMDKRFDINIILVGSAAEASLCRYIADTSKVPVIQLAGRTTLPQLAAIISGAALFIGNDSGPMHLAACFNIPYVVFFGPTAAEKWEPHHTPGIRLQQEDCSGCLSWHYKADCIHQNRCMKSITLEDALEAVETVPQPAEADD